MSTLSIAARPSRTCDRPTATATRGRKRFDRRQRVEAGVIVGAFALALAYFSSQQSGQATELTWNVTESIPVNQVLSVGTWVPLGTTAHLESDAIYRLCVTAQGTGTMVTEPAGLIGTVVLTGAEPVITCADTHGLPAVEAIRPSVTVADPTSDVRVLDASWQRLLVNGE